MWIWGLKGLKGICHEDVAILGQFCAEIMLTMNFLLSFVSSASKREKSGPTFSRFNPCQDDKK